MRILAIALALLATGASVIAHGDNDHVRGTVTQVSAQGITIQTTGKATRTLTLNDKTVFEKSGRKATLADLKVGDRVVVDVPKNTNEAVEIQFGAAPKKAAAAPAHAHPGPEKK
jgi:ribosomal protein S1